MVSATSSSIPTTRSEVSSLDMIMEDIKPMVKAAMKYTRINSGNIAIPLHSGSCLAAEADAGGVVVNIYIKLGR